MTEATRWRLGHRPALDGLRGVAILLVVASHAVPGWVRLGNTGVTLFFVLSGFLITTLLLEERGRAGAVDLRAFWGRRIRRLGPALAAVVLLTMAMRVVIGPEWMDWRVVPVVLLYLANWAPELGVPIGPFGVTWSLAVEEQFYLVWPLLFVACRSRRTVAVAAMALASCSLLARLYWFTHGVTVDRLMGGSDTVAFALLVGCLMAAWRVGGRPGKSRPVVAGASLAAAALLAMLVPRVPFAVFGWLAVVILSGVAVWSVTGEGWAGFSPRWLRWLGSRSYGIYLWHGLLGALLSDALGLPVSAWLVLTPLVAEASYRWVEQPFRARRNAPAPAEAETGAMRGATVSR